MSQPLRVIRHARARRMKLSIDPRTGEARLTLPPRASLKQGLAWAEEQRGWIELQRERVPEGQPFAPGSRHPLEDGDFEIFWSPTGPRTPRLDGDRLLCGGPAEGLERRVEAWLKRRALDLLSRETAEFGARAGVRIARVAVGDPRSRWGSCTATGSIRYSWRLVLMPSFVRRSIVAHEVAHRIHMHHGPAFHAFTAELLEADPAPARQWLRRHGAALHRIGR